MATQGPRFRHAARWSHLAALLFVAGVAPAGQAANFNVAPLKLEFGADQRALALTLTNGEASGVVVEARAFVWEQVDGQDKLTPTNDLVITPPLAEVPGKSTQLIRVGRRAQVAAGAIERSYRLMIQEVVPTATATTNGLRFALRLSLPVFIAPRLPDDRAAVARPSFSAMPGPAGSLLLGVHNAGERRIQITSLDVGDATGKPLARQGDMFYVLAGQTRRLQLKPAAAVPAPGATLTLKAASDAGDQTARVVVTKP